MTQKTGQFFDMKIRNFSSDCLVDEIAGSSETLDVHLIVVKNPTNEQKRDLADKGFFYRPAKIRYFLDITNIKSLDDYLGNLKSKTKTEFRKILTDAPNWFDLAIESKKTNFLEQFVGLYDNMIKTMKRGRNPLRERHLGNLDLGGFYNEGRAGLYLLHRDRVSAGIIVRDFDGKEAPLFDSKGTYFSVSYFAFDKQMRNGADLENYLMMKALEYAMSKRPEDKSFGCGMDTNLYGHHISLGMMPFKRHFGFKPEPDESYGRELVKFSSFGIFDNNAFLFFEYVGSKLSPVLAAEELSNVSPLNRFVDKGGTINLYKITQNGLVFEKKYVRK